MRSGEPKTRITTDGMASGGGSGCEKMNGLKLWRHKGGNAPSQVANGPQKITNDIGM